MNWRHIQLIFQREMIDQLRDRRTLFTITVLPILLYPFLGMLMMQVAQFKSDSAVRVQIVGIENWPQPLPLVNEEGELIVRSGMERTARLMQFETMPWPRRTSRGQMGPQSGSLPPYEEKEAVIRQAQRSVAMDLTDIVLLVEPEFAKRLEARMQSDGQTEAVLGTDQNGPSTEGSTEGSTEASTESGLTVDRRGAGSDQIERPPSPDRATAEVDHVPNGILGTDQQNDGLHFVANLARDRSQIARTRLDEILQTWQKAWLGSQLEEVGVSPRVFEPLHLDGTDTAAPSIKRAMLWSKVLPFVMLVWALTGAFYPAIDLCAGEKERGTLETLLSSPARRREIVWGKLGAISVFSVGSALLNLFSMHLTAGIIVHQLAKQGSPQLAEALGPMPVHALGWLILLLLPMAAFFSALALAVAALARSTKEGQYYLMPLLLVTLPLVALPLMPSLELNLGTSLVPVSGAVFLVRSLIEGRYIEALAHTPVVLLVTAVCCWLSIRWAIRQFESESVMFREAGRWNLRIWIHHLWRDREDTASPAEAALCGVIIILAMFFAQFLAGGSIDSWPGIVKSTVVVQIGLILTPCLLMAIFLTRSLRRALRIHRPQASHLAAATLLGICMHPSYMLLAEGIQQIYKIGDETLGVLQQFQSMVTAQPLWSVLLLLAVMPAVCEELAFRGFIFGGLLRHQGVLRAILISALFFGFTHTVLQQSISASLMGVVLGYIAWRTGGVLCTIIVHALNNTLSLTMAWCGANCDGVPAGLSWAVNAQDRAWVYHPTWLAMSMMLAVALLFILSRRSAQTQKFVQAELA